MNYTIKIRNIYTYNKIDLKIHTNANSEGLRAGLLFASPSSRTASLVPEITTHKLYSFKHIISRELVTD